MNLRHIKPDDHQSRKKEPAIRTATKPKNLEGPSTLPTDPPSHQHAFNPTSAQVFDQELRAEEQYTPRHHDLRAGSRAAEAARADRDEAPVVAGWSPC